jgi:cytoskeletal protein CcmA (bactofilin family)
VPIWRRRGDRPVSTPAAQPARPVAAGPRADFLDVSATMRASLGPDAIVNGRLSFSAPTRIEGTLRGEVRASDLLVVGESGFVEGTIRAPRVVLLGTLKGSILGAERVEIGPLGSATGAIETRVLLVQEGARLDGDCRVGPLRASVHVLAQRLGGGGAEAAPDVGDEPADENR